MKKARSIVLAVFLSLALIFLAVGGVMGEYVRRTTAQMIPVEGTITDFQWGNPIVTYRYQGHVYQMSGDIRTSAQRVGGPYALMIDPEEPTQVFDQAMRIVAIVFGGVGLLLLVIGLTVSFCMGQGERRRQALLGYGRRAVGTVTDVKQNRMVAVNNRHPWVAEVSVVHPLTGQTVTLHSHQLWENTLTIGQRIDVAFDPINEKKYAIDVKE